MTTIAQPLVADPEAIGSIHRAIGEGRTDPCLVLQASLRRIENVEQLIKGWCLIDVEAARAQAEALRAEATAGRLRGPLHGIPVAVKDVIDVAGWPMRAGSRTRAQIAPSTIDATIVAQLRAAGAIILGKAHTTEFLIAFRQVEPTNYQIGLLMRCMILMIVTIGLNILIGHAGLVLLGQAALYGLGAYVAAWLAVKQGVSFLPAMMAGG